MSLSRTLPIMVTAVALAMSLSGCVASVLGLGATAGVAAAEERGIGGSIDDLKIRTEINRLWFDHDAEISRRITLNISEGRVLLTGSVATDQARADAARLSWQVPGVREVYNELQVSPDSLAASDQANDLWIQQKLKTRLLGDSQVSNINYAIDVTDAVVYLLGIAQSQAELDRVIAHARDVKGVRRVVSHVLLKSDPRRAGG